MTEFKVYSPVKIKEDVFFSKILNESGEEITYQFKSHCKLESEEGKGKS